MKKDEDGYGIKKRGKDGSWVFVEGKGEVPVNDLFGEGEAGVSLRIDVAYVRRGLDLMGRTNEAKEKMKARLKKLAEINHLEHEYSGEEDWGEFGEP